MTLSIQFMICISAIYALGGGIYYYITSMQLKNHLVSTNAYVTNEVPPGIGRKNATVDPYAFYIYTVEGHQYHAEGEISLEKFQTFKTKPTVAIY